MWVPAIAIWIWVWRKWREDKKGPDPDAVMAQRQLYADGEFRRHWTRRSPRDLNLDRLELECRHWIYYAAGRPLGPEEMVECGDCASQYLKTAQKGGLR